MAYFEIIGNLNFFKLIPRVNHCTKVHIYIYIHILVESTKVVERWKRRVAFTNFSSLDYTLFPSLFLFNPARKTIYLVIAHRIRQ